MPPFVDICGICCLDWALPWLGATAPMSVEGPRVVKRKETHLETVALVSHLRHGQKVVVWEDFPSDSAKAMWMRRGDIGTVQSVESDGTALITFHGKDSGGRSLSTLIKKKNWTMLRVEVEGSGGLASGKEPPVKRRSVAPQLPSIYTSAAAAATSSTHTPAPAPLKEEEKPLSEEEKVKQAAAEAFLKKDPKKGVVRYTFKQDGPLGLRFSKDVPPWILAVADGSPAARKAPRVPLAGIVTAVNGHLITEKDCQEVMQGLKKRPVTLDIDWPVDQDLPVVNRA